MSLMHLNGEKCLNVICREKLAGNGQMDLSRKWANGLKIDDSEKIWTPGVCLPPPRGNIHVYYSDIQRSSLKLLGQSEPNFMWSIVRKWD